MKIREWYSSSKLAGLSGLPKTQKGIIEKAEKEDWQSRTREGQGGGKEYHLGSLPDQAQVMLLLKESRKDYKKQVEALPDGVIPTPLRGSKFSYSPETVWEYYDRSTTIKKEVAAFRCTLLVAVITLHERLGLPLKEAFIQTANNHNKEYVAEIKLKQMRKATARTMEGWFYREPNVRKYERQDWLAVLTPGHRGNTKLAECSPEAWRFYKSQYLRMEKLAYETCYDSTIRTAKENGWTVPSATALRRRLKREVPRNVITLAREGENALEQQFPSQQRDVSQLHAMEWINGDGYQHNVFVKWPDGTTQRPKTWFWQDVHSRMMVGWRTDRSEHTELLMLSMGDVIEQYGVPSHATIDNTRAAANKKLTGGVKNRYRFKVKENEPLGLFPLMDIKVHFTSVKGGKGWGQAKPIERAFGVGGLGEYVDKAIEFKGAYTGPNTSAKPDNYGETAVPLELFLKVLNREMLAWNAKEKRRTQSCHGVLSYEQAFLKSYAQATIRKASSEQQRLWKLTAESVKVKKGGDFFLASGKSIGITGNRYQNDMLFDYEKQEIQVRFDPLDLHKNVYAYDNQGRFLCECECLDATGFGDQLAAREHGKLNERRKKATKKALEAESLMNAIEMSQIIPEEDELTDFETKVVRGVFPNHMPSERIDIETGEIFNDVEDIDCDDRFSAAIKKMQNSTGY